ncbi:MAG: enoyl-CoA hydratase/isomerase family protein [Saprospiraceae bacterium]|nr:enoyl-CoA hydratase/isomerase family protein [Saprospiraceae bacterium]
MQNLVLYKKLNGIATIQLNRPENHNSLNTEMALRIQDLLDLAVSDEEIRVIILTGSGKSFCAGQDLDEMQRDNAPSIRDVLTLNHNPIVHKIKSSSKPVIAAVNGVAAGAGAVFALACDLIIAKNSASFIQAFTKIGLTPGSGSTYFLPRLIGMQKATAHLLLGTKISAEEAERLGMIYRAIQDEEYENELAKVCHQLCMMPAMSQAFTKFALQQSQTNDLCAQIDLEDELKCMAGQSEDYLEGVTAFFEKRVPVFNRQGTTTISQVKQSIALKTRQQLQLKAQMN